MDGERYRGKVVRKREVKRESRRHIKLTDKLECLDRGRIDGRVRLSEGKEDRSADGCRPTALQVTPQCSAVLCSCFSAFVYQAGNVRDLKAIATTVQNIAYIALLLQRSL